MRKLVLVGIPLLLAGFALAGWWWLRPPVVHHETTKFVARQSGITLGAGFTSYIHAEAVRAAYPKAEVITDIQRPGSRDHPPRNLLTLELRPFTHLGVDGRLTLDFFNDRLMEVTFYPVDVEAYAPALARAEPGLRRDGANRQVLVSGSRRVAANIAQQASEIGPRIGARAFVLWQDRRLRTELDQWDARFGHLPQPLVAQ